MNRTPVLSAAKVTVAVVATLIALVFLAGTSWVGFTAVPDLQQAEALDVKVWLSQVDDGSMQPVRRLDPDASEANAVIQSNLRDRDPDRDFRVEVLDASGIQVFRSDVLTLPTGAYSTTVSVSGKSFFQAYVNHVEDPKGDLGPRIDDAIDVLEGERTKEPCAQDSSQRTQPSRVADRVSQALGLREDIHNTLQQLLRFSLESGAESDLNDAQGELETVSTKGLAAIDKLEVPDDAPRCSGEGAPDVPDWEPDWDAVRADLEAMKTAAGTAVSKIDSALEAVDLDTDRIIPPTGVEGQCNQNTVQLRVVGRDTATDHFWWAVGTPGDPARLTNPEEPTSPEDPATEEGDLLARPSRIYSTQVDVSGVPHSTVAEALVLDAVCLPVPGAPVSFSTPDDSIVTLQSAQATTDENGVAEVAVDATADVDGGMATVNASVDSATASVGLTIIGPPAELKLLLGGTEVERTPNYGAESTVQVDAKVEDVNGNNVADGTPVGFSIDGPHSFTDGGQVTTAGGQASAALVFGSSTGLYTITAESGDVSSSKPIQVVGDPDAVEIDAEPRVISVDTPSVDERSSELTVVVTDSEGRRAPDSTVVEFEFVNSEDADWAYFTLLPDSQGRYRTTNLRDGQTSTTLVGSPTSLSDPSQSLMGSRDVTIRVTATYSVGGEVRGSASGEITVTLQGGAGETIFLPLIRRSAQ